ncbi:MAG TPA: pyridoxal phosphate-dependent aminotransferase [Longimicrobium sp.]|uniref:pyridoxal phosphate-dependent aminotransferase n=1 Tax=Longimicrobium sp. TaxID=2029185 RepID=UPI002EDB68F4
MNPVLDGIAPSLIRALNARKQPGDIDLGLGEPTLRPDPRPFEAATAWVREHGCPYTVNAGFADLRARIAAYHALPERASAENVCVTVGSEEAIYLALKAVLDPARDEVLIVEPCYLAYPKLCALEGLRHRTVAMDEDDGFRPDAARVLEALRPQTRMLILNSPANPTGRVWPRAELQALADGLAARPGPPVYVLSDEVYRELYFGEPPASIGALWPHSLVAGSLSKSNAMTGLRLGWLVAGTAEIAAAVKVHQLVNTAASTFSQVVAREVFADPRNLAEHRAHYADRLHLLNASLAENGLHASPVEGAFYCMVRLPDAWSADSLGAAEALLARAHVVATPGLAFGGSGEGWLRLSWVAEQDALREGIRRIARFFAEPRAA